MSIKSLVLIISSLFCVNASAVDIHSSLIPHQPNFPKPPKFLKPEFPDFHSRTVPSNNNFGIFDRLYIGHRRHLPFRWRVYQGRLPFNAVIGGHEPGRRLYLCQTFYRDGVHPGKVVDGNCNVTYGGSEISRRHFRILTGYGFKWRPAPRGFVPSNAVAGGMEHNTLLYICRARYMHGVHPGKVVGRTCNIGYSGKEIEVPNYQVLVWR